MTEWVLVPSQLTDGMSRATSAGHAYDPSGDWIDMLAARPAIPRDVWDTMVERGARRQNEYVFGPGAACWEDNRAEFASALRAALGNPRVEGDAT